MTHSSPARGGMTWMSIRPVRLHSPDTPPANCAHASARLADRRPNKSAITAAALPDRQRAAQVDRRNIAGQPGGILADLVRVDRSTGQSPDKDTPPTGARLAKLGEGQPGVGRPCEEGLRPRRLPKDVHRAANVPGKAMSGAKSVTVGAKSDANSAATRTTRRLYRDDIALNRGEPLPFTRGE